MSAKKRAPVPPARSMHLPPITQSEAPGWYYRTRDGKRVHKGHLTVMLGGGPEDFFNSPSVLHYWRECEPEPAPWQTE